MIGEKASDMIKATWASRKQEYRRPVVAGKKKLNKNQVSRPVKIKGKMKWMKQRISKLNFLSKKKIKKNKNKENIKKSNRLQFIRNQNS
jgi:hypothetical protein